MGYPVGAMPVGAGPALPRIWQVQAGGRGLAGDNLPAGGPVYPRRPTKGAGQGLAAGRRALPRACLQARPERSCSLEDLGMPASWPAPAPQYDRDEPADLRHRHYFHDVVSGTEVARSKPARYLSAGVRKTAPTPRIAWCWRTASAACAPAALPAALTVMVPDLMQPTGGSGPCTPAAARTCWKSATCCWLASCNLIIKESPGGWKIPRPPGAVLWLLTGPRPSWG